jgi:hypothetical protein
MSPVGFVDYEGVTKAYEVKECYGSNRKGFRTRVL